MKTNRGAAVLSVLLYAQGLLGIAAVAAVLTRAPADVAHAPADTVKVQVALHRPAE